MAAGYLLRVELKSGSNDGSDSSTMSLGALINVLKVNLASTRKTLQSSSRRISKTTLSTLGGAALAFPSTLDQADLVKAVSGTDSQLTNNLVQPSTWRCYIEDRNDVSIYSVPMIVVLY